MARHFINARFYLQDNDLTPLANRDILNDGGVIEMAAVTNN